jgi:hypothetical protein
VVKLVSERVIDSIQIEVRRELVATGEEQFYYTATSIIEGSVNIQRGEVSKFGMNGRNL